MISVSLRPSRHSYAQIVQSGVFCLNLIDQSLCRAADFCGVKSGRDIDKFKKCACTHARWLPCARWMKRPRFFLLPFSSAFRSARTSCFSAPSKTSV